MKKLKYILITLAVIVLGIGGFIVYELKFKSYDTADPEVDALIEETYNIELPDGTMIEVDKKGNIVEDKPTHSTVSNDDSIATARTSDSTNANEKEFKDSTNSIENDSAKTITNNTKSTNNLSSSSNTTVNSNTEKNTDNKIQNAETGPKTKPTTEKVTVASIKAKYANTFKSLENQSRARINSLISQAANEYAAKKSNGESISYGYFYKKYMGAAKGIESATDSTVNVVVGLVEKDLQKNGFDKSHANSFAEDYNALKESLRAEMMDKALSFR